jgi:hypothetical protein
MRCRVTLLLLLGMRWCLCALVAICCAPLASCWSLCAQAAKEAREARKHAKEAAAAAKAAQAAAEAAPGDIALAVAAANAQALAANAQAAADAANKEEREKAAEAGACIERDWGSKQSTQPRMQHAEVHAAEAAAATSGGGSKPKKAKLAPAAEAGHSGGPLSLPQQHQQGLQLPSPADGGPNLGVSMHGRKRKVSAAMLEAATDGRRASSDPCGRLNALNASVWRSRQQHAAVEARPGRWGCCGE